MKKMPEEEYSTWRSCKHSAVKTQGETERELSFWRRRDGTTGFEIGTEGSADDVVLWPRVTSRRDFFF